MEIFIFKSGYLTLAFCNSLNFQWTRFTDCGPFLLKRSSDYLSLAYMSCKYFLLYIFCWVVCLILLLKRGFLFACDIPLVIDNLSRLLHKRVLQPSVARYRRRTRGAQCRRYSSSSAAQAQLWARYSHRAGNLFVGLYYLCIFLK